VTQLADSADLLDRIYRHQRHFYDFTRKYYLPGRDRMIERLSPGAGESVLEIGCGTARNLVKAARRYPHARFFGIDLSSEMLTTAAHKIERTDVASRIQVARADATNFDPEQLFGVQTFSRIFLSFSLSMIDQRRIVIETALSRLTPGGELHILDFGGQEGFPGWFRSGLRLWLARFHVTPCDELEHDLDHIAGRADARVTVERPYRGYAQYAVVRIQQPYILFQSPNCSKANAAL
jgi:S-adenosylmethionine-diacylgycerolhomoserine-N-methlytransferase